jgi:hypothetical protein
MSLTVVDLDLGPVISVLRFGNDHFANFSKKERLQIDKQTVGHYADPLI